jgi:hypothetical protein
VLGLLGDEGGTDHERLEQPWPARAGAAGNLESFLVPGLHRVADLDDPPPGLGNELVRTGRELVDDPQLMGLRRREMGALGHQGDGLLYADQPGEPLGASGPGQQAHLNLGEAELDPGIIQRHPVVAGQAQLQTAAQGGSVDGRHEGLAAGLQLPVQLGEAPREPVHLVAAHAAGEDLDQVLQIRPGDEGALARDHDRTLHGLVPGDLPGIVLQLLHELRGKHVHGPVLDVDDEGGNAFAVD